MRRYLFMLFLCTHWLAQAQTPYKYRYWFDGDASTVQSGTQAGAAWRMDLDVSGLKETFHLFHFQVKDTAGVWSSPHTRCFVRIPIQGNVRATYWFNDDEANKQTVALANGVAALDVSSLCDGFHLLHVTADVASSSHNSIVKTAFFLKVPQVIGVEYLTAVFLVDGKEYKQEQLPTEGGIVKWTLDASGIPHGLHKVQAMVLTPTGAATGVKDAFFYRAMTTEEKGAMRCFYSIDDSPHQYEAGRMENNLFHFDLDVAEVDDGFHRISYMLMGENGTSSRVMSTFFIKTPIGGDGVMQYDYWVNENEENTRKVKLEKRENPFKLISLLPVETCPIRSSSFHFEAEDAVPVIYAKNDFHVRFYDAAGRLTEASKSYVDYNVSQPIEDIEDITDKEGIINCDKPNENGILWFKMDAKIGDSLAIKTSQAATLQIFSPSGKEVYNASGAESVNFSGCHTYEDGTFYIALHDVTGSNSTIDLHYQHIDKYAILRYDVHTVGNGGLSTITFEGNGFNSLVSIDLVNVGNDTIKHVDIVHDFDYRIEATFDFNGANVGEYDMIFHFLDEDRGIFKGLKIEEATGITLSTKIDYPSQYLRNTNTTYTVKITNEGNNTAYAVPIYAYISTPTDGGITHIEIEGVEIAGFYDNVDLSHLKESEVQYLKSQAKSKGHNHLFIRQYVSNKSLSDSIFVRSGLFYVNVAPKSAKTISFMMQANETVDGWFTVPDEWKMFTNASDILQPKTGMKKSGSVAATLCCYRDRIECVGNVIGNGISLVNKLTSVAPIPQQKAWAIADCIAGMINKVISCCGIMY